jgi:hypothetical protein
MKVKTLIWAITAVLLASFATTHADAAAPKMKRYTVTMIKAHLPAAPGNGTDDYRCFLLDPKVTEDSDRTSVV